MNRLLPHLERSPVIAGVKSVAAARRAMAAGVGMLFYLSGTIFDLKELLAERKGREPLVFAHVDLLQGIGKDAWGMRFLAREVGVDGILTTRTSLIRAARSERLFAIQRLFALDSEALKTGFAVIQSAEPDAVELLPALILPHIHHRLPLASLPPIIAGGLVETAAELEAVLRTPALAVSTSREALWRVRPARARRGGPGT